jgi:uncharacterized protein (TIGR02646 family)
MIQIPRSNLDEQLTSLLANRTAELLAGSADGRSARKAWTSAERERRGVRSYLTMMAAGIRRCMYCGDNLGTDIDHFEPISRSPARTFDWPNHLLACSYCNSNQKRALYPCDSSGQSLLIDPTADDPSIHLMLSLRTGEYRHLTPKGLATIETFGLNRADLVRGRAIAFQTRRAVLSHAHILVNRNREDEANLYLRALAEEPHASVLQAILWSAEKPGAVEVLGADVVAALSDSRIRILLGSP